MRIPSAASFLPLFRHNAARDDNYSSYFYQLRRFLLQQAFADRIKVVAKEDMYATGRFEVVIKETKELIHSKKAGMGLPQTDESKQAIVDKISQALVQLDAGRRAEAAKA